MAEGVNLLRDMPDGVKVRFIMATADRAEEARALNAGDATLYIVSDAVMRAISDTSSPYGIAAAIMTPERRFELPKGNALLLDGISDPGNLGTIIRTAAACDFKDVYLRRCADVYSPKTVRATLGALFRINVCEVGDDEAFELASSPNCVALDMKGRNMFEQSAKSPVLLVVGSEAHGLSDEIASRVKTLASLPMKNGIESLNAAVAAAVAMYCVVGRNGGGYLQ